MTRKQRTALALLALSRQASPTTDDGLSVSCATFYDKEIDVAFIHWRTADALRREGFVEFGDWDPDWGTELRITEKGLA